MNSRSAKRQSKFDLKKTCTDGYAPGFLGTGSKLKNWVSIMDASLNAEGGIHFDTFEAGGKLYVLRLWGRKREERALVYEKRKYLLSVLSKFIENSKILC
jgi:hypothetical protein